MVERISLLFFPLIELCCWFNLGIISKHGDAMASIFNMANEVQDVEHAELLEALKGVQTWG